MLGAPEKRDRGWAEGSGGAHLVLAFFDDLQENIDDCALQKVKRQFLQRWANATNYTRDIEMRCILVPTTGGAGYALTRLAQLVNAHNEMMAVISQDPDGAVQRIARIFADIMVEPSEPYYYDKASGVTAEMLLQNADSDVWVFDWDNTLTCTTGFVATITDEEIAREAAKGGSHLFNAWRDNLIPNIPKLLQELKKPASASAYGLPSWDSPRFKMEFNEQTVLKALMGGTARFNALQEVCTRARREGNVADVYILTSNPMHALIAHLASTFFGSDLTHKTFSKYSVPKVYLKDGTGLGFQDKGTILADYILPAVATSYEAHRRFTF